MGRTIKNLKECPFCGYNKTELVDLIVEFALTNKQKETAVQCKNCGARGPGLIIKNDNDRQRIIDLWNQRREPSWWDNPEKRETT